jgi:hypothetical protein
LTNTVTFVWQEAGYQGVGVIAYNALGIITDKFLTEVTIPELNVVITGTSSGFTGIEYMLTAEASPITATLPLTYEWTVGDMVPITHTGGLSDTLTVAWDAPGTYLITLQVSNIDTSVTTTWEVTITERMFIPLVRK